MQILHKLKQSTYLKNIVNLPNNEVIPYLASDNNICELEVCKILCDLLQFQAVEEISLEDATPDLSVISIQEATNCYTLYIKNQQSNYLLVCNPFDSSVINLYKSKYGHEKNFRVLVCTPNKFKEILSKYVNEYSTLTVNNYDNQLNEGKSILESISLDSIHHETNEIIKIVNSIIYDSLKQKASDIHVEIREENVYVFYRIDGSLINVMRLKGAVYTEQIISRIKILANLDIAENRIPQDGRIKIDIDNHPIDFRVSIMPSLFGEDAVLRVLDSQRLSKNNQKLRLDDLQFPSGMTSLFRKMLMKQNGMILITGPTGSGKTTTLYAMIEEVNTGFEKVITIEDPVEYALEGVLQIPVNEKKGLTFAKGLRSILRHDPDIIMVGEIRDNETAAISVQAALTGHLVFTTVHANNVFNVLNRFKYMDVESFSLVSALNCIVSQRLVKLVCSQCSTIDKDISQLREISNNKNFQIKEKTIKKAIGCNHCYNTGYSGRLPINEMLIVDDTVKEQLILKESLESVKKVALKQGKWIPNTQQLIDLLNNGLIDIKQFLKYIE